MENFVVRSMDREKRPLEEDARKDGRPQEKRPRHSLANVVMEALKMDSLRKLFLMLEPLLRQVIGEEVDRALSKVALSNAISREALENFDQYEPVLSNINRGEKFLMNVVQNPTERKLQLQFKNKLALPLFTGSKIEGDNGLALCVHLEDGNTGEMVTTGPEAFAKLEIAVLDGDFPYNDDEQWLQPDFECYEVKEREGRRPLLTGDLSLTLKHGQGMINDLCFTDNSSWIKSRKFRLGVKVPAETSKTVRIREAKTEAFTVKDHRGELYKKHYPPALNDDVWRLDKIGKDGAFHKKLNKEGVYTVQDFLKLVTMDMQKLKNVLGSGMSSKMLESTVEHAKTCMISDKVYVHYADARKHTGTVFNEAFQPVGLIQGDTRVPIDAFPKGYVAKLVKAAYKNWEAAIPHEGINPCPLGNISQAMTMDEHMTGYQVAQNSRENDNSAEEASGEPGFDWAYSPLEMEPNTPSEAGAGLFFIPSPCTLSCSGLLQEPFSPLEEENDWPFDDPYEKGSVDGEDLELDLQQVLQIIKDSGEEAAAYSFVSSRRRRIGWVKIKAVMRWGISVRKEAAARRALMEEGINE